MQNHRLYVDSRWDPQLRGTTDAGNSLCNPINNDASGKQYAPCGVVANSVFNGSINAQSFFFLL